jgi:tetratricopeptide (TPR) repeat protein
MKKRVAILLLVLWGVILGLQYEIDMLKSDFIWSERRPFVPPLAQGVKLMSLGYHTVVADMYWIRTIQYQEECSDHKEYPEDLYAMGNFITDLDPRYHLVYFYTGLNLVFAGGPKDQIIAILSKGEKNCPAYWKTPFLLGFYYYMVLGDYEDAADHLQRTYEINHGKVYALLAARARAMGGSPELAISFLQQMMTQAPDENSRRAFARRIRLLQVKIAERDLTALAGRYFEEKGLYPSRTLDLVSAGYLKRIPEHPLPGHRFVADPDRRAIRSDPPVNLDIHDYWTRKQHHSLREAKKQGGGQ